MGRRIIDISMRVTPEMAVWPGHPRPVVERMESMAAGSLANVTRVAFCAHVGTHVDAPLHFVADGAAIDELPLERLIGRAVVVDVGDAASIRAEDLDRVDAIGEVSIVLFKTRNSSDRLQGGPFDGTYVHITPGAARWLVDRGVGTIGIDYLSVEDAASTTFETHTTLLGAGVVIVEGLDLRGVEGGFYEFVCLPIRLVGADGSPARAVLIGT